MGPLCTRMTTSDIYAVFSKTGHVSDVFILEIEQHGRMKVLLLFVLRWSGKVEWAHDL